MSKDFKIETPFKPNGDQPEAISKLTKNLKTLLFLIKRLSKLNLKSKNVLLLRILKKVKFLKEQLRTLLLTEYSLTLEV